MNLRLESPKEKQLRLSQWHDKFLWWPTETKPGRWTWMEKVARKGLFSSPRSPHHDDASFIDNITIATNVLGGSFIGWIYKTEEDIKNAKSA